ncbi:glutathione S-transferase N-terminal domain-containing protein [Candidatus Albibeggiatoa sp. nov. BB20]|uniref:glutathione S-transferase family protein n=1 Tax=Candidatus Albibeggiatoa sp. nov. BB20 TaxID=3162723 RepID=UPI003365590A
MTMKFYMIPGSCSTGIHILLEEVGLVFEAHLVNLMQGDQHQAEYLALNPKATIPTLLREDGTTLTEFQTIAWWLAKAHPRRKLLPEDLEAELRVLDMMNYAVNTLHGQGFTRIFTTDKYSNNTAEHDAIQARGREIIDNGFEIVNNLLAASASEYVVDKFSIADAALFYVEFWANHIDIPLPQHCQTHYQTMLKRPTVRQVLMEEGYSSIFS